MDLYTTFVATPDLYYEGNPLIREFGLSWLSIILLASAGAALLSFGFIVSRKVLVQKNPEAKKWKSNLAKLTVYLFLLHFVYSVLVIVNNIFSSVYLHKIDIYLLKNLSDHYIALVKDTPNFYSFFQLLVVLLTLPIFIAYLRSLDAGKFKLKKQLH